MDLIIFYSPDKACMTYYINYDQAGYKIEYPFSYIKNIYLRDAEMGKFSGLVVELNWSPNFFIESSKSRGFSQCGDFTEGQQVSMVMSHQLGGDPKILNDQLRKLVSLDSFINRHQSTSFFQGQDGALPNTFMSYRDPAMDQSLCLSMMYDSSSAGVYNIRQDHHLNISNDGTGQMYSTLPMHLTINPNQQPMAETTFGNEQGKLGLGIFYNDSQKEAPAPQSRPFQVNLLEERIAISQWTLVEGV